MLHEFALDPVTLAEWHCAQLLSASFGFHEGRLIARLPDEKEWAAAVREATKNGVLNGRLQVVKRKTIVEKYLPRLLAAMGCVPRRHDARRNWLENAEQEHARKPFRLILAAGNPRNHRDVRLVTDLDVEDPTWKIQREARVQRNPKALAQMIAPLVAASREVLLIDPYFLPSELRWRQTLQAFLQPCPRPGSGLIRLELHVTDTQPSGKSKYDYRWFMDECQDQLPSWIPAGARLDVLIWRPRPKGEGLHARYVLTDRGGIRFDWGLDPGYAGQTTDVMLLAADVYAGRWADYQRETAAFDLIGETSVVGGSST